MKVFRKEKENPSLPRHFPPISGRIKWTRALQSYVEELAKSVSSHPVLKTLPAASEVMRKYNTVTSIFKVYEEDLKNIWNSHEVRCAFRFDAVNRISYYQVQDFYSRIIRSA